MATTPSRIGDTPRRSVSSFQTWIAAVAMLSLLIGCGISGQSPAPGATTVASQPPQSSVAVSAAPSTAPSQSATSSPTTSDAPSAAATTEPTSEPTTEPSPTGEPTPQPTITGQLDFANWPLYIDIDEETEGYPTLENFTAETGIEVNYVEAINDNEEFFGLIQPDLAAGNPTGWDIIVVTDWMVERLARLGYLEPLDHSLIPNFEANAADLYQDQWFDPGNVYSVPYQSGITGIGYNPTLTEREITTYDDLFDPAFEGRAGIFSDMRDMMCLTLLSMGVDPATATSEQAQAAQAKLLEAAERGQFRSDYGNDYYDALAAEDLAISIAWSGDVSQMKLYDNENVEFMVPPTGGMLWSDNIVIPKGSEHVADAHAMINFLYDVENATALTEYIGYFSPVEGVQEQVLADAQTARDEGDTEWAEQLEVISETAFPSNEQLQNVHQYPVLTEEQEREWNDLFNEVIAD